MRDRNEPHGGDLQQLYCARHGMTHPIWPDEFELIIYVLALTAPVAYQRGRHDEANSELLPDLGPDCLLAVLAMAYGSPFGAEVDDWQRRRARLEATYAASSQELGRAVENLGSTLAAPLRQLVDRLADWRARR